MGIGDNGILANGAELSDVVLETVGAMTDEEAELISVYYGSDISQEDAEIMRTRIAEKFPDQDVELQYGGQPIYYYLISVE